MTAAPADWSGTYLIVYEVGEQAHVYNGTDNKGAGSEGATIKNGQIMSTTEIAKFQVTIEKTDNGYSVKLASGKYISGKKDKNGISFPDTAADCTITYDAASNSVLITSNTSVLRYNANNGEERFRFYKSTTYTQQKAIQLYKLVEV